MDTHGGLFALVCSEPGAFHRPGQLHAAHSRKVTNGPVLDNADGEMHMAFG